MNTILSVVHKYGRQPSGNDRNHHMDAPKAALAEIALQFSGELDGDQSGQGGEGGQDKVQTESFVRLVVKQDIMQGG